MEATVMNAPLRKIERHFEALDALVPIHPLRSAKEYESAVSALNALLDAGAAGERHPLAGLVGTLGQLIADYDDKHHAVPEAGGAEALRFLMDQHGLRQADLPEVGSQGVVSEVLAGRRELNARQIRALAKRFKVGAGAFL